MCLVGARTCMPRQGGLLLTQIICEKWYNLKWKKMIEWQQKCVSSDDNFDLINEPTDKQTDGEVHSYNTLGTCVIIRIECSIVSSE